MKLCLKCNIEKDFILFSLNKNKKDGLEIYCKECRKIQHKIYYENNKEDISDKSKNISLEKKIKRNEDNKKYRIKNLEKIKEANKKYRQENREKRKEYFKNYYLKNKEQILIKNNINEKNRRKKDKIFAIRKNISRCIRKMLTENKGSKNNFSLIKYLPYSILQLKDHLEFQFKQSMTWENYGSYWNIDHIYPQSKLPYDSMEHPNFIKCWDLSNLRPLEVEENRLKSDKLIS